MFIIDFMAPTGDLSVHETQAILEGLAGAAIASAGWTDTDETRSEVWVYSHEIPVSSLAVGGRRHRQRRFRVEVTALPLLTAWATSDLMAALRDVVCEIAAIEAPDAGRDVVVVVREATLL